MTDAIQYERHDQIGILRVNRPESRNALNWDAQNELAKQISTIAQNPPHVLILTGSGDKVFIAGGDLRELTPDQATGEQLNSIVSGAMKQLRQLPCPVIGAINGHAIGGGAEILTATDLRVMVSSSQIRFVQAKMGLSTGWGGLARLIDLIGLSRATELMLTTRPLTAVEAQQIGLVHKLCDVGEALPTAIAWAKELATLPKDALAAQKALLYKSSLQSTAFATLERETFLQLYGSANNQEAVTAFREKRTPLFNQKE